MLEDKELESKILSRPSPLPGDREYEKAQAGPRVPFQPSDPPEDQSSGEAELRKGFAEARLTAKTRVIGMLPGLLETYKDSLENDADTRKSYEWIILGLVVVWLLIIVCLILETGRGRITLGSGVLIALISGATVSLVGLLGTVVSYFFTKSNEQISLYKGLFGAMLDKED